MTDTTWEPRALTGLTFDEALEASVCGYRIRYAGMQDGAFIHYVFDGWRVQFADSFGRIGEGSSSRWNPYAFEQDKYRLWDIMPLASEVKKDAWGLPVKDEPPKSKSWDEVFSDMEKTDSGSFVDRKQIDRPRPPEVSGFELAQRAAEAQKDKWGR